MRRDIEQVGKGRKERESELERKGELARKEAYEGRVSKKEN